MFYASSIFFAARGPVACGARGCARKERGRRIPGRAIAQAKLKRSGPSADEESAKACCSQERARHGRAAPASSLRAPTAGISAKKARAAPRPKERARGA
eukprot:365343-Chlamydomonas_euryale.AAC.9